MGVDASTVEETTKFGILSNDEADIKLFFFVLRPALTHISRFSILPPIHVLHAPNRSHLPRPKWLLCGLIHKDFAHGLYVLGPIYANASVIGHHNVYRNSVFK